MTRSWHIMPARDGAGFTISTVEIVHATGVDGGRSARGVVVVIDVLRAFTVSAYALAGGARECLLVPTVKLARELVARTPNAVVSAEEHGFPVAGIAISNSPTQIRAADLKGRTIVQRTSAGTPVMEAVTNADAMYAGSLVVARATAQACLLRRATTVTLVASADFPEDHACGQYVEGLLRGERRDLDALLQPLLKSERYARFSRGEWPGFPPSDLQLALDADRFDFAMPVTREAGHLRVTSEPMGPGNG
jgi:2-phosphosulfolactate phosphatase